MNEALRDWITNGRDTFYCIGSVAGPHPYPMIVRDFQSVIGSETRRQILRRGRPPAGRPGRLRRRRQQRDGALPSVPRRSGGRDVRRRGGGRGLESGEHAASLARARSACCTARRPTCCRTSSGRCAATHSISAGLDYPGVGPEHSYLKEAGACAYVAVTDEEAIAALRAAHRDRGHHPGARERARHRLRGAARADARGTRSSSSTSPVAATRTWRPSRRTSG